MSVPSDRSYTAEHEWIKFEGEIAVVGITEHASEALGDVVYVDLPEVGTALVAGDACGEIESTKSVSELFSPADGAVTEVNGEVVDAPETVNEEPYGSGWLWKMTVDSRSDLLDADEYRALVEDGQ